MAGGFTADQYNDLVNGTLKNMQKGQWTDLSYTLQNYSSKDILKKSNVKFTSGYGIQFNFSPTANTSAQHVRLGEPLTTTQKDYLGTPGSIGWRHSNARWSIDERAITMNRNDAVQLVNLVKINRLKAFASLAELTETALWTAPATSSDEVTPYGIPYYIVKASGTPSLQGGAPSGHTSVAGISPTTYAQWKNWTGQYTVFSKSDAVQKIRTAMYYTSFTPPVDYPDDTNKKDNRFRLYTTFTNVVTAEQLLESQNDNLGNDLVSKLGAVMLRGVPLVPVSYLDNNDTTNPIYGINWDVWEIHFLTGEYMKETGPIRPETQPRTMVYHVDMTYNFLCPNRRTGGFVLYV